MYANAGDTTFSNIGTLNIYGKSTAIGVQAYNDVDFGLKINKVKEVNISSADGSGIQIMTITPTASGIVHHGVQIADVETLNISGSNSAIQFFDVSDPWSGNANVENDISADNISLSGGRYGIFSSHSNEGSDSDVQTKISAANNLTITGGQAAVDIRNTNNSVGINSVSLSGQTVSVTSSQGVGASVNSGTLSIASSAAVITGNTSSITATNGSTVSFSGLDGTSTTSVSVDGNVSVADTSTLSLSNAVIDLADGSSMTAANLTGTSSKIVLHNLENQSVSVGRNTIHGLEVVATAAANDQFGSASNAAEALNRVTTITNDGQGSYSLYGEEGTVSDGWTATVDENGHIAGLVATENASMAAIADYNAMTLAQWRGEMNHLSQRLGDLRGNASDIGSWVRIYGYDANLRDRVDIKLRSNSIQLGSDVRVGNNWIVGGAFSYTNLDADFSNGSGSSDGYSVAAYAAGYFDCGGFIDVIGRVGRLSSDITAATENSTGGVFKSSYDNTTLGLSIETGWRWNANQTFYVEPQTELAYGYVNGDDFDSTANGVRVEQDNFQTLVGRIGLRTGANFAEGKGTVYLQTSLKHDFLGDADATATPTSGASRDISADLGGTWVSYGLGFQYAGETGFTLYGMLERANGNEYQENYRYNLGLRYNY